MRAEQGRRGLTRQSGGAALEYILVSTFAAVVGMAALGFLGKVVKEELARLSAKLGVDQVPDLDDPFGQGG